MQVREQQAQEANEHQVADLKQAVKAAQEEAADLQIRLATVVPRDKLTAAEQRIKVCMHELIPLYSMSWHNVTESFMSLIQLDHFLKTSPSVILAETNLARTKNYLRW